MGSGVERAHAEVPGRVDGRAGLLLSDRRKQPTQRRATQHQPADLQAGRAEPHLLHPLHLPSRSERSETLVGLERQRSSPHGLPDLVLGRDLLLGLAERRLDPVARDDHNPVAVSDDPVAGRNPNAAHDDRDVAVGKQLPARHAVLRRHVAGEDGKVLAQHVLNVARAAVDHGPRTAAGRERRHRQLAEVRGGTVVGLVDGDMPRRDGAEHLEHQPDGAVVVVARMRATEHRIHRSGQAHPFSQRGKVGRQRLLEAAVPVEDVGERAGVQGGESAREIGGRTHV